MTFDHMGHYTDQEDIDALCNLLLGSTDDTVEGVEVGTWAGQAALAILENVGGHVYCVDHWLGNQYDQLGAIAARIGQEKAFKTWCANMHRWFPYSAIPLIGTSELWASVLPKVSLDFVFIDAGHDYQSVLNDIKWWTPIVRAGGILCGHDYGVEEFPGVKKAVDETGSAQVVGKSIWWRHVDG